MREISIIISILLFYGCANIVAPTGGEKDILPPEPIIIIPENRNTNFSRNSIVISFDEFIQLTNPKEQIIISPAVEIQPDISAKKRTLVIEFQEELQENTTYTINFGNSIRDLNESNPINNFTYVFSTGDYLDSLAVGGKVVDAATGRAAANVLVMLYKELNDSVIYKAKPFYFTRTNDAGDFVINNIREDQYKIIALNDLNNNYLYDRNELLGFKKEPIYVSDTLKEQTLRIFKEDFTGKVNDIRSSSFGRATIISSNAIDTNIISSSITPAAIEINKKSDTITYWYSNPYIDSVKFLVNSDVQNDTFNVKLRSLGRDSILTKKILTYTSSLINDSIKELNKPLVITFPNPIANIEKGTTLLHDSLITYDPMIKDLRSLEIVNYLWKEGTNYTLRIPAGTITDIYGMINPTMDIDFKTKSSSDYGTLTLRSNLEDTTNYILQLFTGRNNDLVLQQPLKGGELNIFTLANVTPANYMLRLIIDRNNNSKWDTGNYLQGIQPEEVIIYPDPISIKPNWESEIEVVID